MMHFTGDITTATATAGMRALAAHSGTAGHRTHYTKAMAFIASHGWFAAITKDGLLALSACNDGKEHEADDMWHEEPMLFDVDSEGYVSSREVRNWLGY